MPSGSKPVRTCTGCGERRMKEEMVRIVADPSGRMVPDLKGRLPSRGAYVCPDARCIGQASRGRLAASLGIREERDAGARDIAGAIADSYHDRLFSLMGQVRKTGRFTSGTNLVEGELRRRRPDAGWLGLVAGDASDDTAQKATARFEDASIPWLRLLSKDELGMSLGKSPRSVVLVKDGGLAKAIKETLDRYHRVLNKGGSDQ